MRTARDLPPVKAWPALLAAVLCLQHGACERASPDQPVAEPLVSDEGLHSVVARRTELDAALLELARASGAAT